MVILATDPDAKQQQGIIKSVPGARADEYYTAVINPRHQGRELLSIYSLAYSLRGNHLYMEKGQPPTLSALLVGVVFSLLSSSVSQSYNPNMF